MVDGMQVTQYLAEVRSSLHQLVRLAEAKEDALLQLQILSDIRCQLLSLYMGELCLVLKRMFSFWCFREKFREMNFRVSFGMTFSTLFSTKVHKMFLKHVVNLKGNLCENFSENKFNDSSLENTRKKTFLLT